MRDFDKQLERYGDELKSARCPYSDAELDREIRCVVWNTKTLGQRDIQNSASQVDEDVVARANGTPRVSRLRRLWPVVAAAACIAAVLIPLNMSVRANGSIASVDVDGEHLYFACNNSCSPEGT
ncbi:MAG: hypothetical protein IJR26_00040 [Bacteroidales bacterium]|nr:hypothetical protein [Bacteroidales bacterium]